MFLALADAIIKLNGVKDSKTIWEPDENVRG